MTKTVALAGFMGVGKSTVGAVLASLTGLKFVDLDDEIALSGGVSVAQIFSCEGEAGFRRRERAAVKAVMDGPPVVLALGGGTLHQDECLALLREKCFIVSLVTGLEEIRARLGPSDEARPLWADAEARFEARAEGYLRADVVVDVSGMDVHSVASAVLEVLPCE
jgi:shikimate kinase